MSRRLGLARLLVPVLAVAVGACAVPSSSSSTATLPRAAAPSAGANGIGDPYWPLDGNGGIDVRHYDVDVDYDFTAGRLSGETTLSLRATADLSRFNLDLLLPVSAVTVDGEPATYAKPTSHELAVTPTEPLVRGSLHDVVVTYAGKPAPIAYAGERNWLADRDEVVTMNEPHMAPWWFPANDHPRDKATFDISVTGPATHQVVSNGLLVDRSVDGLEATTHWRTVKPMATYLAFFGLGRYAVEQSTRDGLPSYIAVSRELPADQQRAATTQLRKSDEITAWLAGQLGPYPFESTGGLVTSLEVGFALENQTRPTYPSAPADDLLVHELAHQWFGDSVSVHRWRDIWLNEGFATFMEARYAETHGGRPAQQWLRSTYGDYATFRPFWRVDIADPGAGKVFDNAVYTRGAMALQALRHRIGDRRFWVVMRTWAREHRYGTGTVGGFTALAEKVSGQQLDGFFRAWLSAPRPPARTRANGLR